MEKLSNPKETIQVLQKHEFQFKKKFGQNFLIDPHVLDKIVDAAQITKDDFVLEIGPGIGTLTQYLCENARQVLAVEIDDKSDPYSQGNIAALRQCRSAAWRYFKTGHSADRRHLQ